MMGGIILLFMGLWIVSLGGGILLAKLTWTPPVKGNK